MIVYLARNKINGKGYVGKTTRALEQRSKEHLAAAKMGAGQLFGRAIRKHGFDAFEWKVLYEGTCTEEDLDVFERHYIDEFKVFGDRGYNLTQGGDGVRGWSPTADHREKIRQAHLGEKNYNFGKKWGRKGPHTEETKQKLRVAHLGLKHTEETKVKIGAASSIHKRKSVSQISKDGTVLNVYPSLQEAARAVSGQANKISEVLCGHRLTHKGYVWQYALDGGQTADRVEV